MAIRTILNEKEDILKKKSRPVEQFDSRLAILIDDMINTLKAADGVGLAAVQVGILRRVVVIDTGSRIIELVNPVIVSSSGHQEDIEGCLSCPGNYGITKRPMKVTVEAYNRKGEKFKVDGEGLIARAFCHEIDHLDGKLFYHTVIRMLAPDEIVKEK